MNIDSGPRRWRYPNMRTVIAIAMLLVATSARAEFLDGDRLFGFCDQDPSLVAGYIAGWADKQRTDHKAALREYSEPSIDADEIWQQSATRTLDAIQAGVCLRKNVTLSELVNVFCKYLGDNSLTRNKPASVLIEESMAKKYPCAK